ncbi:Oidioi.mRNA.OKI2018_I69.chr2.g8235.t1.cds [Oikopleura dioica]|uniref:Oidioi.mRNA.OKI2018_I69.chr2.g8235.t1.cds n=1 Tax=Oikopleura dioica TaxID=34765 RepID=A0ABN7TBU1_OIKDI|nr:Oidioi.mRNA.OKI2018_I69.chr2.g8235.t1.cds [Oikopleura dioica]
MVFYFHKINLGNHFKPLSKRAQRVVLTCSWISFGLIGAMMISQGTVKTVEHRPVAVGLQNSERVVFEKKA